MSIRAIIFDVYGTLLAVGPPPADAETGWERLWRGTLGGTPRLSLVEFSAACDQLIAREHEAARAAGVSHPEVFWPAIVAEALPELLALDSQAREEFLFQQARLWHTVQLMPGAAEVLRARRNDAVLLGLASNAQPYTLRELDLALAGVGLSRAIFHPSLCFWSFEHGFSKPAPHVFRWLTARLRAHGVTRSEILMVGDRLDHDLAPARAQGWQVWLLTDHAGGNWPALARHLQRRPRSRRDEGCQSFP